MFTIGTNGRLHFIELGFAQAAHALSITIAKEEIKETTAAVGTKNNGVPFW
jgi:hypothetical protein